MARVSWRGDIKKLRMRIENLPEEMLDMAEEVIGEATQLGASKMRANIKESDTMTGLSERPPRHGRVKSGLMYDSVEAGKPKRFRRSVRGEFGWGVDGETYPKYFDYQEQGFRHYITGADVTPMHAWLEAFLHTREWFFQRMREEARSRR